MTNYILETRRLQKRTKRSKLPNLNKKFIDCFLMHKKLIFHLPLLAHNVSRLRTERGCVALFCPQDRKVGAAQCDGKPGESRFGLRLCYSLCFIFGISNSFLIALVQFYVFRSISFRSDYLMVFCVPEHIEIIESGSFQFFLQEILNSILYNIGRIEQSQFQIFNFHE